MKRSKYRVIINAAEQVVEKESTAFRIAKKVSSDPRASGTEVYLLLGEKRLATFINGHQVNMGEVNQSSVNESSSAPTANSVSGGAVDNTVVTSPKSRRRKDFGNCAVFEVGGKTYDRCRVAKGKRQNYTQYLDDDEREEIQNYARSNPTRSIAVKDKETGAHTFLKIGSKGQFPKR